MSFHIALVFTHVACARLHAWVCVCTDRLNLVVGFVRIANKGYLWAITEWICVNITKGLQGLKTITH